MLTLIENGLVFAPEQRGRQSILLAGETIAKVGWVDRSAIEKIGVDLDVIDAADCFVTPGLIDPHQHLIGGSGEGGFSTQTPEITFAELVEAGITTVVGCLGVDNTTKTMPALLAKAKALAEEGMTAFIWSGGYSVPPVTLTGSLRTDLLFVAEVIGAGEIAISDIRASEPSLGELARLVSEAYVGGMLSRKAGLTHFHVGDHHERLEPLRSVLGNYAVQPEWLYPTHIGRNRELMREAAAFTGLGAFVDLDTIDEDLPKQLQFFLDDHGDPNQLTVSSDAAISSPRTLFQQVRACVLYHKFPLEEALRLVTVNTARALKLGKKGRLEPGGDADVLVLHRDSLEVVHVFARGKQMLRFGKPTIQEKFPKRVDLWPPLKSDL